MRPSGSPRRYSHGPVRRTAVRDLIALFVEKVSANVLRMFDTFQIVPHLLVAALLVRTDSIVQHSSAQCFPRRTARAKGKRHQNSQHEEQCLRHPERHKNTYKQTLHGILWNPGLFSRTGKNIPHSSDGLDVLVILRVT